MRPLSRLEADDLFGAPRWSARTLVDRTDVHLGSTVIDPARILAHRSCSVDAAVQLSGAAGADETRIDAIADRDRSPGAFARR